MELCIYYPLTSCSQVTASLNASWAPTAHVQSFAPLLPMPLDTIFPGTPTHSVFKDGVSSSPFGLKLTIQLMTLAAFTS